MAAETIRKDDVENAFRDHVVKTHYIEDEALLKSIITDVSLRHNTDHRIVALKLGLIDTLYSTNLNKGMDTTSVTDIALVIADPKYRFDERILAGDTTLVQDIVTDPRFVRNNFSLISKYCKIHEHFLSETDDFVIYDSVVAKNLYRYLPVYKGKKFTAHTPLNNCFEKRNYLLWCDYINQVIRNNELGDVHKVRRKIDWFIWGMHNGVK